MLSDPLHIVSYPFVRYMRSSLGARDLHKDLRVLMLLAGVPSS